MEFLDKLVLPQSAEHIELLHYILMIVLFLFIPYISLVFGGIALSVFYKFFGFKKFNSNYLRFSGDVVEIVTTNKSTGLILGIVPLLTIILLFTQLLHQTNVVTIPYLVFSLFAITIALIFLYIYKYSIVFKQVLDSYKNYRPENEKTLNRFNEIKEKNNLAVKIFSLLTVLLLIAGLWVMVAAFTLVLFPDRWGDTTLMLQLFSWEVVSRFISFLAGALSITGAAVLYVFFYWDGGLKNLDEDYKDFVKKTGIYLTFLSALVIPIFMLINIIALPNSVLSGSIFGFAAIALFFLFLGFHFLYAIIKKADIKFSGAAFYMILLAVFAIIIKDQLAMSNATELHSRKLAQQYQQYLTELKGDRGEGPKISGAEVFETRCTPCHAFDRKIVGPPYNEVLAKYEGKKEELIDFISNPVKVNPDYPPMPNPGLTPPETEAVTTYLLEQYKGQ